MSELDNILGTIRSKMRWALDQQGKTSVEDIKESLSVPGSPVPFVASAPGEPSFDWYGGLMMDAISYGLETDGDTMTLTVLSDAVDQYVHPGYHFSEDAEFGHYWDGVAYDPRDGQIKTIAKPHMVAPRPHMWPGFMKARETFIDLLCGSLNQASFG